MHAVRALLAAALAIPLSVAGTLGAGAGTAQAATGDNDVIANLWSWNWNSVAAECTGVLGPAGYGAVQVSPPQDSLSKGGSVWWDIYQPVDYDLTSKFGTEAQFKAMVTTCHTAGVKVYVDTVINHMTGQGSTSYGGVTYGKYSYPAYSAADFHYYPDDCSNSDGLIASGDYTGSATNVQQCELVGLADLDTGSTYVRSTIAAYLNKLLSYGADGFRVDAAKHISPTDLSAIYGQLNTTTSGAAPFLAQEVIYGSGEAVQPSQYTGLGDVLDFQSGRYLLSKFNGNISDLQTFGDTWGGMVSSGSAVTFVANHDTERDGSTLNYKSADYALANYFSLAWTYGVPQVYSAYTWSSTDAGPPAGSTGYVTDTECTSGAWTCTDRATGITGMVGFHNAVKGTSVANWYSDGSNVIAFSRGSAGWIAINNESAAVTRTFTTGLAAGTYCDVISGTVSSGSCTGTAVTVSSSGTASVTVPAGGAVAIDVNATGTGSTATTAAVTFNVTATTAWGTNVYVVGSVAALGSWSTGSAVALSSASYPVWSGTVSLPANTAFEYKYIKKDSSGNVTWESGSNRSYTTGTAAVSLSDTWK